MTPMDWIILPIALYAILLCLKAAVAGKGQYRALGVVGAFFILPALLFIHFGGDWHLLDPASPFNAPSRWWMVKVSTADAEVPKHVNIITGVLLISLLYVFSGLLISAISFLYDRKGAHLTAIHKLLLRWGIVFFGLFLYLSVQEVNLTPLVVGMGAASLVIGLALQEPLANLFSGITIDMEGMIGRDEWIDLDGQLIGRVVDKDWRSTTIETLRNETVVIPNRVMAGERVKNYNRPLAYHAHAIEIGASYNDPPIKVKQILRQIVAEEPLVLVFPEPRIYVESYGDFAINYRIVFWLDDYSKHMAAVDAINTRIWYEFKRDGVEIPFPIRTVHVKDRVERADEESEIKAEVKDLAEIFQGLESLESLKNRDRDFLARNAHRRRFPAGEPIIRKGEHGDHAYFIVEGACEVVLPGGGVKKLHTGSYFGEMGLLGTGQRTATITAGEEGCTVVRVDRESMGTLFKRHPELKEVFEKTRKTRREEAGFGAMGPATVTMPLSHRLAVLARRWLVPW